MVNDFLSRFSNCPVPESRICSAGGMLPNQRGFLKPLEECWIDGLDVVIFPVGHCHKIVAVTAVAGMQQEGLLTSQRHDIGSIAQDFFE